MLTESSDKAILTECPYESAVIATLSYFSIFHHPLKADEIQNFLSLKISTAELDKVLLNLKTAGSISEIDSYWSMKDIISEKIIRDRKTYEALFQKHAPKVARNSRIISRFPFVRGIMISGSVSKGLLKNDGDIDFFIITAQNRLWICRTLLILYKKIFRLNSKKFFCLNYFIGEGSLEIPDRNIFTATEIACLVPTYNEALCEKFKQANLWYKPYLPVFTQSIRFPVIETGKESALKKIVEHLFMNITGEKTDEFLMNYTYHHWQKKFSGYTPEVIELAMRSRRNVSKHHPNNFQEKVLHLLNEKIKEAGFDKDLKRKFNC